jgi:hypothetical protein
MKAAAGLAALLLAYPAGADTLTMNDHRSINGAVVEMAAGVILFQVGFLVRGSVVTSDARVPVGSLESIEFNSTLVNEGAPDRVPGIGPPSVAKSSSAIPQAPPDTIVLRSGEFRVCRLVRIDKAIIKCEDGPANEYPRAIVMRILVGAK